MNPTSIIVVSILYSVSTGITSGVGALVPDLEVKTKYGNVKGGIGESRDGRSFYKFLGIPYAKAERFQAPQEPEPWSGTRDATAFGPFCPQYPYDFHERDEKDRTFVGDENCLNLHIFTPQIPGEGKLLPVLVWFHSGGGDILSGEFQDNPYYMDTDTVVVSFNSRLGFLGYLNLGIETASGNQKLKDQVMALKWIQENIKNFGGDPNRVTIAGSDSGAAEVSYHLISPMSKGLFSGAISHSTTFLSPYMFIRDPINQAKKYGEFVGCPTESPEELLACLKKTELKKLVPSSHRWVNLSPAEFLQFGPSIETYDLEKAFLTESPAVALNEGRVSNKVPWMIGSSEHYGLFPVVIRMLGSEIHRKLFTQHFDAIMPNVLDYRITAENSSALTQKLSRFFLEGKKEITAENILKFQEIVRQRQFALPVTETANKYHKIAPVYSYKMLHVPVYSMTHSMGYNVSLAGTFNDEVSYQFPYRPIYPGIEKDSKDYEFSKKFVNLIASFVENGKPTKTWDVDWLPFDETFFLYGVDNKATKHILSEDTGKAIQFWRELYQAELKSESQNPPKESF